MQNVSLVISEVMVSTLGKLTNFDIRILRIFVAVVECGGLVRAQGELNLSLSSISGYLTQLETRMSMRLCQRGRRGFSLTEKGRVVYEASKVLFSAHEDFRSIVGGMQGELVGELKIGVVDNIVFDQNLQISEIISEFQIHHKRIWITLFTLPPNSLEVALMDGTVHIGIGQFFRILPSLQYEKILSDQQLLYCGKKHEFFDRAPEDVTAEELKGMKFADRGYAEASRFHNKNLTINPAATGYSAEAILILVLSGLFVSYLPKQYAANWMEKGLLRSIMPEKFKLDTEITVALSKSIKPSSIARAFIDEIKASVQPL
jgi:LysR family transcriptional regulator, transcriptional activator for bauABCD operon